ncbi:MAG: hypothetical protein DRN21_01265 [Thermoplasmata archaeon]|nr:MAG: hypothetical protein DRN21_01265 [Thermoplasmata archaeon]HDO75187.1 hypothetical protein [Candidatus Poribacteria bacterium]HEX28792.1 hypothetical protein [Candidatus Poribacteria bacterium]
MDQYEREYPEQAMKTADEVGGSVEFVEPIYDENGTKRFLEWLKINPSDIVLVIPLSMSMWEFVDEISDVGLPTAGIGHPQR